VRPTQIPYNGLVGSDEVCVFCRKRPVDPVYRPFCCERCKLLDLARWVEGSYRVPAESAPAAPDDDEPGPE
jgi:hypothetical protein